MTHKEYRDIILRVMRAASEAALQPESLESYDLPGGTGTYHADLYTEGRLSAFVRVLAMVGEDMTPYEYMLEYVSKGIRNGARVQAVDGFHAILDRLESGQDFHGGSAELNRESMKACILAAMYRVIDTYQPEDKAAWRPDRDWFVYGALSGYECALRILGDDKDICFLKGLLQRALYNNLHDDFIRALQVFKLWLDNELGTEVKND